MRRMILSLAIVLAPLGVTFIGASSASAEGERCWVANSYGGVEPADNFQDPVSCREMTGGDWY